MNNIYILVIYYLIISNLNRRKNCEAIWIKLKRPILNNQVFLGTSKLFNLNRLPVIRFSKKQEVINNDYN